MDKKYVAFDLDGTLLDSMKYWRTAIAQTLENRGLGDQMKDLIALSPTLSVKYCLRLLREKYPNIALDYTDILSVLERNYKEDVQPKPGVLQLFDRLKAKNTRMCIISTTPTRLVKIALDRHNLLDYFDFILTSDDYPKDKSDPEIFREAARRFGCATEDMAFYEDALYSIKTAKSLGIYVVGVEDRYQFDRRPEIIALSDEFFTRLDQPRIKP